MNAPVDDPTQAGTPARVLQLVRMSLVTGVLMFGGITYYVHSQPGWMKPEADGAVGYIVLGVWALAAALTFWMVSRYRNARTRAERAGMLIPAWAAGELAAMAGGVHYFLTDDVTRFVGGLLIFASALILFPIPPDEDARR